MKKTMMYLPDEMHRFLAREARERGLSMAEIAREAIAQYRSNVERPPRLNGMFGVLDDDSPETDLATSVDEALREHFSEDGPWERDNGLAGADRL